MHFLPPDLDRMGGAFGDRDRREAVVCVKDPQLYVTTGKVEHLLRAMRACEDDHLSPCNQYCPIRRLKEHSG